jgi:hypothetical protein
MQILVLVKPVIDVVDELRVEGSVSGFEFAQEGLGRRIVDLQIMCSLD